MKPFFVAMVALFCAATGRAQYSLTLSIKSAADSAALVGAVATVKSLNRTTAADSSGTVTFANVAAGRYTVKLSYADLEEKEIDVAVPQSSDAPPHVFLEEGEEEEEVIVTTTRVSRSISDIPTRVETISGEELAEKANMKPGDIRMLLNESTGIQTQQTSATSYNSSIRIQGLDGRYTQLLRDGFPLYAGFSGGLSIMQVAPLDLKQVEVIKGSASTLYGGGAIAGLVNLVSKTPTDKREISFLANGTSAGGLDLSGFWSQRFGPIGVTVFASSNTAAPYDPAGIGLTAIPKFERYTLNPRLFFYGEKTTANVGISYITENRTGGSLDYIKRGTVGYFERNNTDRITTQLEVLHRLGERSSLRAKNSYTRFHRTITLPQYAFKGLQQSSYSELTFTTGASALFWIAGINLLTDDFAEERRSTTALRNYRYNTVGGFVQNTWQPLQRFALESGVRADYTSPFGWALLPRVSALYKFTQRLSARLGGGAGYKTPTVFNEESERLQLQRVLPINTVRTENERSVGGNLDVNYRTHIGEVGFTVNGLFYYTLLNKPLVLQPTAWNEAYFQNADGHIDTKGLETNLRFTYHDFKLFVGYTYADVLNHYNGLEAEAFLVARHRLNNVLVYEKEERLKIGLEAYYFSPQRLSDGATGRSYWVCGAMAEKLWDKVSVFLNFENILDARQTRFDTIYTGPLTAPVFRDIYAPVDGFVVNGGVKLRL